MVTPPFQLGVILDVFWWLDQVCIWKSLQWFQDGAEGGEEPEHILAFGQEAVREDDIREDGSWPGGCRLRDA